MQADPSDDYAIHKLPTPEERQVQETIRRFVEDAYLPLARGEAIGCFGLTEPDYGSNPGGMITRARRLSSPDRSAATNWSRPSSST